MLPKVVLVFFGLSFGVFGVWALLSPAALAAIVHFSAATAAGVTEIRAFYGGLEIGLAALLLGGAFYAPWTRGALLALIAVAGGIAAGRCVGLAVDASLSGAMLGALIFEAAGAALGIMAYRRLESG